MLSNVSLPFILGILMQKDEGEEVAYVYCNG